MAATYDTIGLNYAQLRKPDPRIASCIHRALGMCRSVLNVGAGAGSYEPRHCEVTALEPSVEMMRQRPRDTARLVRGMAEELPFADGAFDASMAVLTVHHWKDKAAGLSELRRVTRGPLVILTFDPAHRNYWLADYIPQLVTLDDTQMPALDMYAQHLGPVTISAVPVPHDCTDGFLSAYWRRPQAYLDARVRSAISSFWVVGDVGPQLQRLQEDIQGGAWSDRHRDLMQLDELDCGYRLVVSPGTAHVAGT